MAAVTFDKVTRRFPGHTPPAVDSLDLDIADGEFIVLVGPSGSGKSTALRMLAGLEDLDDGSIRIGDQDVTTVPPAKRDIAMVFQNYALYPHMDVADNIGFALKLAGVPKEERDRRVREAARLLDLTPLLGRKPKQLSGGQRQRVAMGRAIVRQPRVFLMDEPLSNLDAKLRVQTRAQIAELTSRLGVTTVYVTHDQVEAMTMGDRVAVLRGGVLQQVGLTAGALRPPSEQFRGQLHRVTRDEPAHRRVHRRRRGHRGDAARAAAARRGGRREGHRPDPGRARRAAGVVRPARTDPAATASAVKSNSWRNSAPTPTYTSPPTCPVAARWSSGPTAGPASTAAKPYAWASGPRELHAFDPDSGVRLGQ